MRRNAVIRIRIITAVVLFLALCLVARLYQLQILHHDDYVSKGEQQYVHTVRDLYSRGSIYMTTKDGELVSAATIQSGYVLAVDPSRITNPEAIYDALATQVDLNKENFISRATLPGRTYVEVIPQLSIEDYERIESLSLPGVLLYKNQWRYYPGGPLGARSIGFVGYGGDETGDELSGRYGLERYYDEILSHQSDQLSVNFFAEIFSNLGSIVFDTTESRTGDVVTSLEPTVMRFLASQLQSTNDTWQSKITGGIIMNPKNGEIYALDVAPTYDLNDRSGVDVATFRNPLVENVYEFGSIVKALTMAAGLDSNAVSAHTTYYDSGKLELDTFTIGNYDGRGRGTVDMQEVLNQSLNTGVAFVVDTMGKQKFRDYFLDLKLDSEAGIDLPNETYGLVDNLNSPRDIEYATASFGQGIALTPIAITRALATLGNGGHLVTPHLVTKTIFNDGTTKETKLPPPESVFSAATSEEISRMLTVVVDDALRGGNEAIENYSIAAKTGTAQIADSQNGGYYDDRYLHSFFGYFPSYDPQFLVFLYTVEPKEVRYASETLTDPFISLAKFLINYYNIPPDR